MKAWQFSSVAGGMEKNLTFNASATLPPHDSLPADQTLVQVITAALNPVDYKIAEIPLVGRLAIGKPASPSLDYVGRVMATGPNSKKVSTQDLKPGEMVFGRLDGPTKFGTLAEYTIVPRAGCVPVPEGVTPDDAASIGTAGLTAYQCIVPNVKSGDRVFINGGSGGTGIFGIQIAKLKGCFVTTTCSTPNVELCKSLGADEVIDYTMQNVVADLKRMGKFDLVVDNVGMPLELYWQAHHFTKEETKYVQVGGSLGFGAIKELVSRIMWPTFLGGGKRKFQFLGVASNYDEFKEIGEWMQQGKLKTKIDEVFSMDEKGPIRGFERVKTGRAKGKVLVHVTEP